MRTYLVSESKTRYFLSLSKLDYPKTELATAYAALRRGIRPTKAQLKLAMATARRLLRLTRDPRFFTSDGQYKMEKSNAASGGALKSYVMHLAAHNTSGYQLCQGASDGCRASCLFKSGHGATVNVEAGRVKRTRLCFEHRSVFCLALYAQIERLNARKYSVAIRLNGTSDIPWEIREPWIFSLFPLVQFYDYTKLGGRFDKILPHNYDLTFSLHEQNRTRAIELLGRGVNVAVVLEHLGDWLAHGQWAGFPILDGSADDRRWIDPKGYVVGLRPLGPAKKDSSGFVLRDKPERLAA